MENTVLTENAYKYILDKILSGSIKPGQRIREDQIAAEIRTSRTPVREAMNQLCQKGFITYVKRKGLYCIQLNHSELEGLIDLRESLEEFMYIQCAKRASQDEMKSLNDDILRFDSLTDKEKRHAELDIAFHIHVAECTHNDYLVKYITEIETLLLIVRNNLQSNFKQKDIIEFSWKLHQKIVDAMKRKDVSLIKELNHEHVQLMRETQLTSDVNKTCI